MAWFASLGMFIVFNNGLSKWTWQFFSRIQPKKKKKYSVQLLGLFMHSLVNQLLCFLKLPIWKLFSYAYLSSISEKPQPLKQYDNLIEKKNKSTLEDVGRFWVQRFFSLFLICFTSKDIRKCHYLTVSCLKVISVKPLEEGNSWFLMAAGHPE